MEDKLLSMKNLSVGYARRVVIGGITLDVSPGRIVTLIGPNGAGKSTILKTVTRQLAPVAGAIYLDGKSLSAVPEGQAARTMAILMTERTAPELMTCREVVSAGRYPYTGRLGLLSEADRAEVRRAMELVGVDALAETDFSRVSDGQRQLVMLARAICQRPRLLVLDEPTSYLDIRHKLALLSILKDLVNREGLAVVMSLHELDLAQKVSDTVVCVSHGAVDRAGPPEEIFSGGYIQRLYGVAQGAYNELFGSPELAAPTGPPQVFVIGGGGSGIAAYRRLQRQGIAFAAGVLHENDLDLPVARALAARVITEKAFTPIGPDALREAAAVLERCGRAVCCLDGFGPMNAGNRTLLELARRKGLLTEGAYGV